MREDHMDNSDPDRSVNGVPRANSKHRAPAPQKPFAGRSTRDQISLEAVVNVLVKQGLCTEEQLLTEESRLRAVRRTMTTLHFRPVRMSRPGKQKRHPIRRWASQRRWSRQLGTFLFGWKWQKFRKKERSGSSDRNPSRAQ